MAHNDIMPGRSSFITMAYWLYELLSYAGAGFWAHGAASPQARAVWPVAPSRRHRPVLALMDGPRRLGRSLGDTQAMVV